MNDAVTYWVTWAFFAANAGRIFAYFPQILAAVRCKNGAVAVSRMTWTYFATAHFTGCLYGLMVIHDSNMAIVFLGNFIACVTLVGIVTWKKMQFHRRLDRPMDTADGPARSLG